MNRAFSPLFKSMLLALLAVSATASAVEAPKPAVKADAAKGATLYADGDAARGLPACVSCHGAAGNSTITVNPKLAGQHESYLYKQLVDFTTPERNQPVMTTYAKMLSDADKKNIAAYLGAQLSSRAPRKTRIRLTWARKFTVAALLPSKLLPAPAVMARRAMVFPSSIRASPASTRTTRWPS